MIGDAFASGKRKSTTKKGPEYKAKNHKGRSHKHIAPKDDGDSGGEQETGGPAAHATKGMKAGHGAKDGQKPHKQREHKEVKYLHPREIINEWAQGKRKFYK